MTALKIEVPPVRPVEDGDSRSWSQFSKYVSCPKSLQLSKVQRVRSRPGAWLSAGTAVHSVVAGHLMAKAAIGE